MSDTHAGPVQGTTMDVVADLSAFVHQWASGEISDREMLDSATELDFIASSKEDELDERDSAAAEILAWVASMHVYLVTFEDLGALTAALAMVERDPKGGLDLWLDHRRSIDIQARARSLLGHDFYDDGAKSIISDVAAGFRRLFP